MAQQRKLRWWPFPVLGAVTTWAVTWLAAVFTPFSDSPGRHAGRGLSKWDWQHISITDSVVGTRVLSTVMVRADQYTESDNLGGLPRWARLPDPPRQDRVWQTGFYEVAMGYGWPMRAAYLRFSGQGRGASMTGATRGAIPLPPNRKGAWYDPRGLPYMPIWPGLAADLVFWTGAWWVVLLVPGWVRRTVRRRRGRCEGCGYSRAGLAGDASCPECGTAAGY